MSESRGYQLVLIRSNGTLMECEELFASEFAAEMAGLAITILPGERYSGYKVLPIVPEGEWN